MKHRCFQGAPLALGCVGVEQRERKTHLARKQWVSSSEARKVVEENHILSSDKEESDAEEKADIGQALDELHRARGCCIEAWW